MQFIENGGILGNKNDPVNDNGIKWLCIFYKFPYFNNITKVLLLTPMCGAKREETYFGYYHNSRIKLRKIWSNKGSPSS